MIELIIFSYNRASQLRLLLESIKINANNLFKINIIYKSSNDKFKDGYDKLIQEKIIEDINWVKESIFQDDVKNVFKTTNKKYMCFFTDDDVLFKNIDFEEIDKSLKKEEIFCFSLRLGQNTTRCYTMNTDNVLVVKKEYKNTITWDWTKHYLDYNYPLSVDGHIFRTEEIHKLIRKIRFNNPNSLEASLQMFEYFPREEMEAFKENVLVGVPVNIVNTEFNNLNGLKYPIDTETLNKKYLEGYYIDYNKLNFSNIIGCHQEIEYKFNRNN